jgi:hypothetical protein
MLNNVNEKNSNSEEKKIDKLEDEIFNIKRNNIINSKIEGSSIYR